MKTIPHWKWENIWLVFIITSCLIMPFAITWLTIADPGLIVSQAPSSALAAALAFGFLWGFGAIFFGLSVDRLGVSVANSLVIGLSSALGALVPLILRGGFQLGPQQLVLFSGVAAFIAGVWACARAGRLRDKSAAEKPSPLSGYFFAIGSGVMSAVFNIGYTLALPIADAGQVLGNSTFASTSFIWLLMLGAGSIPNICFCLFLLNRNRTFTQFSSSDGHRTWGLSIVMGLLWGASIFLYGAATPMLGPFGPSIGWPLSLAVALVFANLMGFLLGEWRNAGPGALGTFKLAMIFLFTAIILCAASARLGAA